MLDLLFTNTKSKTNGSERDTLLELTAIPKLSASVLLGDNHHRLLVRILSWLLVDAHLRTSSTIKNISFCSLKVALAHELLLNKILHILNVCKGRVSTPYALCDTMSNPHGCFRIFFNGEECLSDRDLNLGLAPWNDITITANQSNWHCLWLLGNNHLTVFLEGT